MKGLLMSIIPLYIPETNLDVKAKAMSKQGILPNTRKSDYIYGMRQEIKPYVDAQEFEKGCLGTNPALKSLPQWKQDVVKQSGWAVDLKKVGKKPTDVARVLSDYSARQARALKIDEAAFLDSFCAIEKECDLQRSTLKDMGPINEIGTLIIDMNSKTDLSAIKKIGNLFINGEYGASMDEAKALLKKLNFNPKQFMGKVPWFNALPLK